MKLYHGSSSLPDNTLPKGGESNGVFLTPNKEFSQIFGRRIHTFELEEEVILDLRLESVKNLIIDKKLTSLLNKIDFHENGLPFAFNHVTSIESLESTKLLALKLGYKAALFFETNKALSIELWDPTLLIWISSEDNPNFDDLNS